MPKMRTIFFTVGFSSIKLYLTPAEASYNVSPFSFQGEIFPCFVFLQRNKNCYPLLFIVLWTRYTKIINIFKEKKNGLWKLCYLDVNDEKLCKK